nr:methyltransferase domain-containing protein [Candidatus Cloacimonadota bacterium]
NIEVSKMDAHNLTFPDNSFDVVTCRAAIHHFDNPDKNLSAIHRILNKNGFIVIMDFCFSEIAKQALTSLCMLREDDFRNYFTFHDYCNYLESNSFEIDTIYTYTLPRVLEEWVSVAPRNVQQRILNAFFKLDERILKELNIREDNNKHYMIYRIVEIIAKKS